ncbi:SHOCT domain-containing protein [Phaeovulum sp. W22_SRMD_FR3]|uniref:SHOCT domain-containing protein n=1 Tax=Phaeovulum sp. W22_SRMD_FR3 TaxID=3240274 RepID=UPI003F986E39
MLNLTPEGSRIVADIAGRYGVSVNAVETLLAAVSAGNGMQAQFNHPELGGMGQWSSGGMTMVGDMFNNGLKATVAGLCAELSYALGGGAAIFMPLASGQSGGGFGTGFGGFSQSAWPAELGQPASSGGQNNMRYAVFPDSRRLAIDTGGRIEIFDTGDHWISGVSQQQGGDQSLSFTSQYGTVRVHDLPRVQADAPLASPADVSQFARAAVDPAPLDPAPMAAAEPVFVPQLEVPFDMPQARYASAPAAPGPETVLGLIRQLAELRDAGILTEDEFAAKKAELLARL